MRRQFPILLLLAVLGCVEESGPELIAPIDVTEDVIAGSDAVDGELGGTPAPTEVFAGAADPAVLPSVDELPAPPDRVCRKVRRVAGANRFATAADIATLGNYPTGGTVVVARGDSSPDALTAGPLARKLGGPLLLTAPDELPGETQDALEVLRPSEVVIVGGTGAISTSVASKIDALAGRVRRIAGSSRFDTAARVAREIGPSDVAFVASGADESLVDAVSAAGPAAWLQAPILLVQPGSVPPETKSALADLGVKRTILVGGTSAVSQAVASALPRAKRAGGATRYQTALAVIDAARAEGFTPTEFLVARGDQTADALAASPLGRATVLSGTDSMPRETADYLVAKRATRVVLLGGTNALNGSVAARACSVFHQIAALDGDPTDHVVLSGGIPNHADPNIGGSIAWFLKRAGSGDIVTLFGGEPFPLGGTLAVPSGVTLRGFGDGKQVVTATAAMAEGTMVGLSDGSGLRRLVLDAAHQAKHIVKGDGRTNVVVASNTLRRTRNTSPTGANLRCHAAVFPQNTNLVIAGNLIEDVGYPKQNGTSWDGICAGIYAERATGLVIEKNEIRRTLTAGIDFTGSRNVRAVGNKVIASGRNREYGKPVADGITAYHNLYTGPANVVVEANEIVGSGHNGIHLSGPGITVRNNRVDSPHEEGILHQDHKTNPTDCAYDVVIHDNQVSGIKPGHRHVFIGNEYRVGGVDVQRSGANVFFEPGVNCP